MKEELEKCYGLLEDRKRERDEAIKKLNDYENGINIRKDYSSNFDLGQEKYSFMMRQLDELYLLLKF